jgi:glycosyltransferase involved in cell wall biosynthesis
VDIQVTIFEDFEIEHRVEFLKSLSLLSVPVPGGEAFGAYQVEALAAGVPIVQPNVGGYPEFIEDTGGGILYEPNDADHLAEALASLLIDQERARQLGEKGRKAVLKRFSMREMAENILYVYKNVVGQK